MQSHLIDNVDKQIPDVSSAIDEQLLEIACSFTKGTNTVSMILKMFVFPWFDFFNSMFTWLSSILQIFTITQEEEIVQFLMMSSSKMGYGLTGVLFSVQSW